MKALRIPFEVYVDIAGSWWQALAIAESGETLVQYHDRRMWLSGVMDHNILWQGLA